MTVKHAFAKSSSSELGVLADTVCPDNGHNMVVLVVMMVTNVQLKLSFLCD